MAIRYMFTVYFNLKWLGSQQLSALHRLLLLIVLFTFILSHWKCNRILFFFFLVFNCMFMFNVSAHKCFTKNFFNFENDRNWFSCRLNILCELNEDFVKTIFICIVSLEKSWFEGKIFSCEFCGNVWIIFPIYCQLHIIRMSIKQRKKVCNAGKGFSKMCMPKHKKYFEES